MRRPSVGRAAGVPWSHGGRATECGRLGNNRAALLGSAALGDLGGRYWVRTSDLFGVNEARYHCANRPSSAEPYPIVRPGPESGSAIGTDGAVLSLATAGLDVVAQLVGLLGVAVEAPVAVDDQADRDEGGRHLGDASPDPTGQPPRVGQRPPVRGRRLDDPEHTARRQDDRTEAGGHDAGPGLDALRGAEHGPQPDRLDPSLGPVVL